MLHLRPAAASCMKLLASCINHLSANEKQHYIMTLSLWKYIAGYTVANLKSIQSDITSILQVHKNQALLVTRVKNGDKNLLSSAVVIGRT